MMDAYPLGKPIPPEPKPKQAEWVPIPGKKDFWINRKQQIAYGPKPPDDKAVDV